VTTKDSTYKWDTCAGQAILNALGGGCLDTAEVIENGNKVKSGIGQIQSFSKHLENRLATFDIPVYPLDH
jgi:3'-phosphoadenosine 5'-phosphosulfate (PAPS) 3'-phosphatase